MPARVEPEAGGGDVAVRLVDDLHGNAVQVHMIGQQVGGGDGGIAALAVEGIGETLLQAFQGLEPGVTGHRLPAGMIELTKIVDAVAMIGMVVGPDHPVDAGDVDVEQLLAKVRPRIDQDPGLVVGDEDGNPAPAVPGVGRIALAPVVADAGDAARRAAAEDGDLHQVALLKSLRKLAPVRSASASTGSPRKPARKRAVSATKAGSQGRPRWGTGARKGASVSISRRSEGIVLAVS